MRLVSKVGLVLILALIIPTRVQAYNPQAGQIAIEDAEDHYVSTTVEGALQEIGSGSIESDPVASAINGILKSDGTTLSPATVDAIEAILTDHPFDFGMGSVTAGGFIGNVTGDVTGSSGSCTGNSATVTNATFTTALTVDTGTVELKGNVANSSVLTLGAGASSISGSNTGDQDLSSFALKTTTISTTAPLSGGGDLSVDRTFSIPQANTSTDGYLSSTDWTTFNNKQDTISVTTPITLSGASVGIVNKGTTTQVLHGNVAGNAAFSAIVDNDVPDDITIALAATVTTNANLTGEVTSTGNAAVLDPTCISGKADTTIANEDYVLFWDDSDSTLKKTGAAKLIDCEEANKEYFELVSCTGAYETVTFPTTVRNVLIINDDPNISVYVDLEGGTVTNGNMELKALERLSANDYHTNSITLLAASATVAVRVYATYLE